MDTETITPSDNYRYVGIVASIMWGIIIGAVVGAGLGLVIALAGLLYYGAVIPAAYQYDLRRGLLTAKVGLLTKETITINAKNVTDIRTRKSLSDRLVGTISVIVNTAGRADDELSIDYVSESDAEKIRTEMSRELVSGARVGNSPL